MDSVSSSSEALERASRRPSSPERAPGRPDPPGRVLRRRNPSMIHVATSHTDDPTWIPIQGRYFKAHLTEEYRVYAFLSGIDDVSRYESDFFYLSDEKVESTTHLGGRSNVGPSSFAHAMKLNLLADIICSRCDNDTDLLMFIDGDAFPIGDVASFARESLRSYPLLAVQRLENNGDSQPHPCFCMTTVGFWRRLRGD